MEVLKNLRRLQSELGAEVFLVGGGVRDRLRRKDPRDYDFVVRGVSQSDFEAFMKKQGRLDLVGESFGLSLL